MRVGVILSFRFVFFFVEFTLFLYVWCWVCSAKYRFTWYLKLYISEYRISEGLIICKKLTGKNVLNHIWYRIYQSFTKSHSLHFCSCQIPRGFIKYAEMIKASRKKRKNTHLMFARFMLLRSYIIVILLLCYYNKRMLLVVKCIH